MPELIDGIRQGEWFRMMRSPLSLREAAPLMDVHYNTLHAWETERRWAENVEIEKARVLRRCLDSRPCR